MRSLPILLLLLYSHFLYSFSSSYYHRSLRQVNDHAQRELQKIDSGIDIFAVLDDNDNDNDDDDENMTTDGTTTTTINESASVAVAVAEKPSSTSSLLPLNDVDDDVSEEVDNVETQSPSTSTSTAEELIAESIMIKDANGHDININKIDDGNVPLSIPSAPATTWGGGVGPGGTTPGGPGVTGGGQLLRFPWKLHHILRLAEQNCQSDIISWLPGGNGFKVHNRDRFCAEIMPGYFASQKYRTFQRRLNAWGFESVEKGLSQGARYHQFFVKGHPELCDSMYVFKQKVNKNCIGIYVLQ